MRVTKQFLTEAHQEESGFVPPPQAVKRLSTNSATSASGKAVVHRSIDQKEKMKRITAWLVLGVLVVTIPATLLVAREKERERKTFELIFRLADLNSDGKLSSGEVSEMRTGEKDEKSPKYFKKLDRNGDGKVTLEEFKRGKEEERRGQSRDRP